MRGSRTFLASTVAACAIVALAVTACREDDRASPVPVHARAAPPLVGTPAPVDPYIGDLQSSVAKMVAAGSALAVKSSGGYFIALNACNEGTLTTWVQCFDVAALDAGGLNDGGVSPLFLPLRLPAGTCGSVNEPQAFQNGLTCYSSSTQSILTVDAGVQPIALDVVYR